MVYRISSIKSHIYSSNYGNNKVFGQPKSLRSGVILEIQTKNNMSGYGETYLSGYLPELTKSSFDYFCDNLIGRNLDNIHEIIFRIIIAVSPAALPAFYKQHATSHLSRLCRRR